MRIEDILPPFPADKRALARELLARELAQNERKLIILDDDPTGVQTVHDVCVYTDWSKDTFREAFGAPDDMFFILTNSRALTEGETERMHREIARNIVYVSKEYNRDFALISRSDSTLRGHYPLETRVLREELEAGLNQPMCGEILCPYFREGGRYTADDVHYVYINGALIPAARTEFARDAVFGYKNSELPAYIEEKTKGEYKASSAVSVSLNQLRALDVEGIRKTLESARNFDKIIVNATDDMDVQVFCAALYGALRSGKRYLYRTAASFVKALGGIEDRPLLTRAELLPDSPRAGGIIIVGSHTEKTTAQLNALLALKGLRGLEFDSDLALNPPMLMKAARDMSRECGELLKNKLTPVVYTRRALLTLSSDTPEAALARGKLISEALTAIVSELPIAPAFVVAKGGITSSDIGVKALNVRRAVVLGQIQPGVPVWRTGAESRFPGIPYVIFPGNVGERDTLKHAVSALID